MEGKKHDEKKPRFDLLCGEFLFDLAAVMTFGAKKYADRNYMGLKWSRVFSACMRHLWAYFIGDEVDKETGKSHLAHAGCCVMMLYEMQKRKENDDRPFHNTISCHVEGTTSDENGSGKGKVSTE